MKYKFYLASGIIADIHIKKYRSVINWIFHRLIFYFLIIKTQL